MRQFRKGWRDGEAVWGRQVQQPKVQPGGSYAWRQGRFMAIRSLDDSAFAYFHGKSTPERSRYIRERWARRAARL